MSIFCIFCFYVLKVSFCLNILYLLQWFDTSNSRCMRDGLRSAFGVFEAQQQEALEKMQFFIRNMVFKENRKPLPFMRGILCQIRALRALHEDLKECGHGILLTCRTNQDCVENIFSCFRGISAGPNDNPDQLQVMQRAKIRLLCSEDRDHVIPLEKPRKIYYDFFNSHILFFIQCTLYFDSCCSY